MVADDGQRLHQLDLLQFDPTDWGGLKQQTLISSRPGVWEVQAQGASKLGSQ